AALNWSRLRVFIVFDYDAKAETRQKADAARTRLARALKAKGAGEVFNVRLPPGPDGVKQGVDDFLVAHGAEAFRELVEKAIPIITIIPGVARDAQAIPIITIIPPVLEEPAYHGPIGQFLRAIDSYTEATAPAILAHLLPAIGVIIGPGPYIWAGT